MVDQNWQKNNGKTQPSSSGSSNSKTLARDNTRARCRWEPEKRNLTGQSGSAHGHRHANGYANGHAYNGMFHPPIINSVIHNRNNSRLFTQSGYVPGTPSCGPVSPSYFLEATAPVHNAGSSTTSGVAQDDNITGAADGIHAQQFSGSSQTNASTGYNGFIPDGRALRGNSRSSEQHIASFGQGSIVNTNSNPFPEYRYNCPLGQMYPPLQQDFRYQQMPGQFSSMNALQGHGSCYQQSPQAQTFAQTGCQNFTQAKDFCQNIQTHPWTFPAHQQQGSTLSFAPIQDASSQSSTASIASTQVGEPMLEDERRQQTNKEKMIKALRDGHEL